MSLTEKNSKIVEIFVSLKEKINLLLDNYPHNKTHLQNYLYFTVPSFFNYTESIIILCEQGKFNAAQSLLRSLFEAHINVIYFQTGDVERRLAITAKAQFDWRKKVIDLFIKLIKDYPNLESPIKGNLYNKDYLETTLEGINKYRLAIITGNQLTEKDKDPNLLEKAKLCDAAKIEKSEPGHFELMYHLVYRQLSSYTHLDIQGIESFVNKDSEGKYIFKEKPNEDLLISESIGICVALIKDLYKNEVIMGNVPESLNITEKLVNEK